MNHGGSQPITLPLSHVAWRRAAAKAARAFGGRALRPADAVRATGEALDCTSPIAREVLAAGEHYGIFCFAAGFWSVATDTHKAPRAAEDTAARERTM
jgi:hypothetical protein